MKRKTSVSTRHCSSNLGEGVRMDCGTENTLINMVLLFLWTNYLVGPMYLNCTRLMWLLPYLYYMAVVLKCDVWQLNQQITLIRCYNLIRYRVSWTTLYKWERVPTAKVHTNIPNSKLVCAQWAITCTRTKCLCHPPGRHIQKICFYLIDTKKACCMINPCIIIITMSTPSNFYLAAKFVGSLFGFVISYLYQFWIFILYDIIWSLCV